VTTGNAERSTERSVEKNTEKRGMIKSPQKEVEKPKAYQPAQRPMAEGQGNKPLIREVQKPKEAQPMEREGRTKEQVISKGNGEATRSSSGPAQGMEKNRNFVSPKGGMKPTPPVAQDGRETSEPKGVKKEVQQIPGPKFSVRGTGKSLL
jgi:hypothetical protein